MVSMEQYINEIQKRDLKIGNMQKEIEEMSRIIKSKLNEEKAAGKSKN